MTYRLKTIIISISDYNLHSGLISFSVIYIVCINIYTNLVSFIITFIHMNAYYEKEKKRWPNDNQKKSKEIC